MNGLNPKSTPPQPLNRKGERVMATVHSLQTIVAMLLARRSPTAMIAVLKQIQRPQPSAALQKEVKALADALPEHLQADRKSEALATVLAAVFADGDVAISRMRRKGMLRASKYGYRGLLIANIARAVLAIRPLVIARDERFDYLTSILALTKLAPSAKTLHDRIVKILEDRENIALKTVLAVVNSRFYNHSLPDMSLSSLKMDRYSIEELSDAASLIFMIYGRIFPIHDHCCNHIDAEGVVGPASTYERLFVAAVRLTKYKDAEELVDGLPFKARIDRGGIRVASSDPDIERSIRLGYIQGQNQVAIRAQYLNRTSPALTVREFIAKGFERGTFDRLVELADFPVRRFRLFLPTAPQVFQMFRTEELFRDELESLLVIDADVYGDHDPNQQIAPHVTMMDLLKVQRYFNFISCLYQRKLETVSDEADRAYLTFTSTVPVVPHDRFLEQMQLIFDDEAKSRAIIDLLALKWDSPHLDLQYTPLVDLGSYFVFAPHVLAASNLVRNVTVSNKLRSFALASGDPMMKAVIQAFASAGFKVRSDFKIRAGGKSVELDIVAWRENALFLFECKNAYHPCSPHEMRNSLDAIREGRDQLDVRSELFRQPHHQAALFAKLGWDVPPTDHVHTGIIIANRIFHGAQFNGHPVRQAHELINVLRSGTIGGDGHNLRFWANAEFTTGDLITYLGGDSVAAQQLAALQPVSIEFGLGGKRLIFDSYALDPDRLIATMFESYGKA